MKTLRPNASKFRFMKFPFETWDRSLIVKKKGVGVIGKPPENRAAKFILNYGIINVDKPPGPTSHMTSAYVKGILGTKKCGHSGTLDPKVTGVLPVALGRASRVVQALLPAGKEYVGIMHLHGEVSFSKLKESFEQFTGEINQLPPVKSAVRRRYRKRMIYYFEVIEKKDRDVLFRVGCQAGTYVRKLCHDIGQALGCGAHMAELRRTRVAAFDESSAVTLQDIKDAYEYYKRGNDNPLRKVILPVEKAVEHLPKLWVLDSAIQSLSHGRDLGMPGVSMLEACIYSGKLVAVMSLQGELVALGIANMNSDEIRDSDSGIAVRVHKVFFEMT